MRVLPCAMLLACGGSVAGGGDSGDGSVGSADASAPDVVVSSDAAATFDTGTPKHTCNAQGVTVLAKGERPEQIAIDDSFVYWGDNYRTGYRRVAKDGGSVTTVNAQGFPPGQGLVVDDTTLYADSFLSSSGGHITRAPKAGGMYTMIASTPGAMGLAVDATYVYWAEWLGSIWYAPKPNGAPKVLVKDATAFFIALDGGYLYYTMNTGNAAGLKRVLVTGGTPELLAPVAFSSLLAVDATDVYYFNLPSTQNYGTTLSRVSKSGGTVTNLATDTTQTFGGLAVDDDNVYWSGQNDIHRLSKKGGSPTTIASNQRNIKSLVVDERCLYFLGVGDGEIRAMPKK